MGMIRLRVLTLLRYVRAFPELGEGLANPSEE